MRATRSSAGKARFDELRCQGASIETTKKEQAKGRTTTGTESAGPLPDSPAVAIAAPGVSVPLPRAAFHDSVRPTQASSQGSTGTKPNSPGEGLTFENITVEDSSLIASSTGMKRPTGQNEGAESGAERTIGRTAGVDAEGKTSVAMPEAQANRDDLQTYPRQAAPPDTPAGNTGGSEVAHAATAASESLRPGLRVSSARPARASDSHQPRNAAAERNTDGNATIRFAPADAGETPPLRELGSMAGYAPKQGGSAATGHLPLAEPGSTFAALDAARSPAPATWIHAGTRHAEAGYLDPALGWVGVRADAIGDRVHAAVVPVSPEAAQVLGSHLAGLNTFLSEQHGASTTVTIGSFESGQGGQGSSGNLRDQGNADTNHETLRQANEPAPVQADTRSTSTPVAAGAASAVSETAMYISVVA